MRFPVIANVGLLLVLLMRVVKANESPCLNASACNPSNTTEAEEEEANEYTLDLRIIHLFVVLVSSCIGLSIPVYGLRAIGDVLFMLRSFCAGIMLSLAFCHILPETAFLGESTPYKSLGGVFIMVGILLSVAAERLSQDLAQLRQSRTSSSPPKASALSDIVSTITALGTGGGEQRSDSEFFEEATAPAASSLPTGADGRLACGDSGADERDWDAGREAGPEGSGLHMPESAGKGHPIDDRQHFTAHAVEAGIVLHTVVLGVAVGMWDEGRAGLVGMTIAMAFHQLFEGVGLGVCIRQAGPTMPWWRRALMAAGFALSFPLAICVGIGLAEGDSVDAGTKEWVLGVMESMAGGILIHMGLVSFLAEDFLLNEHVLSPESLLLRWKMKGCFATGMAFMAILAIWA